MPPPGTGVQLAARGTREGTVHTRGRSAARLYSSTVIKPGEQHHVAVQEVEGPERYKHEIVVRGGRHVLEGDVAFGEDGSHGDTAPAPKDLALAAVALCTSMTVRMYADMRHLPLRRVKVDISEIPSATGGHVPEGLHVVLYLDGDLTSQQRERILAVAGKCPVKQMMTGKMPLGITSELSPG